MMGCTPLGLKSTTEVPGDPAELAYLQQAAVRSRPGCSPVEWKNRCPALSTMFVAEKWRGGCAAAGCIALEGEAPYEVL